MNSDSSQISEPYHLNSFNESDDNLQIIRLFRLSDTSYDVDFITIKLHNIEDLMAEIMTDKNITVKIMTNFSKIPMKLNISCHDISS